MDLSIFQLKYILHFQTRMHNKHLEAGKRKSKKIAYNISIIWGENEYVYIYGWIPLLSNWNYHSILNWLYYNIKTLRLKKH